MTTFPILNIEKNPLIFFSFYALMSAVFIFAMRVVMSHPTTADIQRVRDYLTDLQARICAALEQQEQVGGGTATFAIDEWQRPEGGGGR